MIRREEGSSLTPYYDSAGIPTIGIEANSILTGEAYRDFYGAGKLADKLPTA